MLTAQPIRFMTVINLNIYQLCVSRWTFWTSHLLNLSSAYFSQWNKSAKLNYDLFISSDYYIKFSATKKKIYPPFYSIEWLILKFVATSLSSSDWTSSERGMRWVQNNNFIMYKFLCEIPLCFTNVMYLQIYFWLLSLDVCLWISKSDQTLLII